MNRRSHFSRRRFDPSSPLGRLAILLLAAALVGVGAGLLLPRLSLTVAQVTGQNTATGSAADALNKLTVESSQSAAEYDRNLFGFRKTDDDGDGCDVREQILTRDLKNVTYQYAGSCKVASGTLDDPYTGTTIQFVRGQRTSQAVQIDHVVALENAWKSGADQWSTAERYRFGNDPYNLLAVDGPANQDKGSASAAYWLPANASYRCDYVARQIGVKTKYSLSVTSNEKDAMLTVLHSCPGQPLPGE
ncbi:HNH endonuclease family protein [Bifidobacterium panos]|uniref:Deoxyribonuclease n=1 Tax=Bifidobacterium panos TaxID=2675321 RepID=A0ABX1SUS0_9BIFI|nr:HNH endonuclease family protein [Bifidobacterium sp. DSM 109963]NMN01566.1 deoxyribonuclease [Bifidobacterium sp. DSM 109963]